MTGSFWAAVAVALVTSVALPLAVRPLLKRLAILDVPGERSSHVRPTLRGGGIAPAVGMALGTLVLATNTFGPSGRLLIVSAFASAAFATLGLVDDFRNLSSWSRAAIQIVLGLVVSAFVVTLVDGAGWLYLVGPIAIAAYVNVANFMDGIDTISGLHGGVVGGSFVVTGLVADRPWLVGLGSCLAVALLAFIPWNVMGGGMFLGDVGSYLLGGTIAVAAVAAVAVDVPLIAVLGPLVPYLVDTSSTIMRRMARGERWLTAHNTHVYQQLARRRGHVPTSLLVTAASVVCAAGGMFSFFGAAGTATAIVVFAVVSAIYLALPKLSNRFTDRKARVEHV